MLFRSLRNFTKRSLICFSPQACLPWKYCLIFFPSSDTVLANAASSNTSCPSDGVGAKFDVLTTEEVLSAPFSVSVPFFKLFLAGEPLGEPFLPIALVQTHPCNGVFFFLYMILKSFKQYPSIVCGIMYPLNYPMWDLVSVKHIRCVLL